jgi:hypothetical protein
VTAPIDSGPVGRSAAAAAFNRLAEGLATAAEHLVGPGQDLARHGLDVAARAALDLARLHAPAAPAVIKLDPVDYVADLLGPDAAAQARARATTTEGNPG